MASFDQKAEVAHDVWNQWLQASDHPASCHEAGGLFTKFLSKDLPSTAAALAMGRNATDSEGLEGEGVATAGMVGGVVVAEAS